MAEHEEDEAGTEEAACAICVSTLAMIMSWGSYVLIGAGLKYYYLIGLIAAGILLVLSIVSYFKNRGALKQLADEKKVLRQMMLDNWKLKEELERQALNRPSGKAVLKIVRVEREAEENYPAKSTEG